MDSQTLLYVVAIFAIVALVFFAVFRQKGKVKLQGPAGISLEAEGSNEQPSRPPGVLIENVRSHKGGLSAQDSTGRGAIVRGAEVQQDIDVRSGPDPKVLPPE